MGVKKVGRVVDIDIEEEMARSYGRYAETIILNRAIPDVRDGLKPVQRRIVYAMFESGNTSDKPYRKSAKTVGDVMGNYHPHGDQSIYDALVRLAQPWKMRMPIIDGHGNFGSPDDDPPAAMRYTEARVALLAAELTRDIRSQTVDWVPNFDEKSLEPSVLPCRFPNLLVNGSSGVSTGFATEIPPHNLGEVIDAVIALIEKPSTGIDDLMALVQGPDFPTGGIVIAGDGLRAAYETGRGRIKVRGRWTVEKQRDGKRLIKITELPYGANKARLVADMDGLRMDKEVHGVVDVRDESDREGTSVVVELSRAADVNGVIGLLLKKTELQQSYNFNMVAIHRRSPECMGLKPLLKAYLEHQKEVIRRRSEFLFGRAKDRLHIVEGLIRAVDILDDVIATIRASENRLNARENLMREFTFSEAQADAILDLRLHRLTGLQLFKLQEEQKELKGEIEALQSILGSARRLLTVIKKELKEIRKQFLEDRRTTIEEEEDRFDVSVEALVKPQDVIVVLTGDGYVRRVSRASFRATGESLMEAGAKESDAVIGWSETNTTHKALILTKRGVCFTIGVHALPEDKWAGVGTALVNVVSFEKDDAVVSLVGADFSNKSTGKESLFFVTAGGMIKRTPLVDYDATRSSGIIGIGLKADDEVVHVHKSDGRGEVILVTEQGQSIRFAEAVVSESGRAARGVRGIGLGRGDRVVAVVHIPLFDGKKDRRHVVVVTETGKGKRTPIADFEVQLRAGKGARIIKRLKQKPHKVVAALLTDSEKDGLIGVQEDGTRQSIGVGSIAVTARSGKGFSVVKGRAKVRFFMRDIASSIEDEGEPESEDEDGVVSKNDDSVARGDDGSGDGASARRAEPKKASAKKRNPKKEEISEPVVPPPIPDDADENEGEGQLKLV